MNHYLYLLTFPNNMKYIGCRSTKVNPKHDVLYLGSGKALPIRNRNSCIKEILFIYNTRQEAIAAEIQYILDNDCVNSIEYYNLKLATYDRHGDKSISTNVGNTKENSKYIQTANIKRSKYVGKNRTPAQKATDKRATGKKIGACKSKGHIGTSNCAFIPWYYITPNGKYVEVFITKQDFAKQLNITARQLGHRFHYNNEHKKAKTKPLKGWTFGNLPKPTKTDID